MNVKFLYPLKADVKSQLINRGFNSNTGVYYYYSSDGSTWTAISNTSINYSWSNITDTRYIRFSLNTGATPYASVKNILAQMRYFQITSDQNTAMNTYTTYADRLSYLESLDCEISANTAVSELNLTVVENNAAYETSGRRTTLSFDVDGVSGGDYICVVMPPVDCWGSYTSGAIMALTTTPTNCVTNFDGEFSDPFTSLNIYSNNYYYTAQITFMANTGYSFNSSSFAVSVDSGTATIAINSVRLLYSNTVAVVNFTVTRVTNAASAFTLTANASGAVLTRQLTQTLANCTSDTSDGSISQNSVTVALTAGTHAAFASDGTSISITGTTYTIAYNSDYTIATITLDSGSTDVYITASAVVTPYYTVTQTLSNCTSDFTDGEYAENASITIHLTPSSNYWFKNLPTLNITPTSISLDSSTGIVTITFTLIQNTTITATTTAYVMFAYDSVANCTVNLADSTRLYIDGTTALLTVVANNGYYFDTIPYITYTDSYGVISTANLTESQGTYSIDLSLYMVRGTIYLTASAIVSPQTDKYGLIRVYNPTVSELSALSDERFIVGSSSTLDLGQYILTLIKLYCNLTNANRELINLGGHITSITSDVVLEDMITTDCGEVEIEPYFDNAMDYENTFIRLYLPFMGFANIDTEKVMGKTIHLEYKTNVLSGDSLIVITDFDTNDILYTFECNMSFKIPYILNQTTEPNGELRINSGYLYGFTPFVEIDRNISYFTPTYETNDNRFVLLSTLSGYAKVEVKATDFKCSNQNAISIVRLLREGVVF